MLLRWLSNDPMHWSCAGRCTVTLMLQVTSVEKVRMLLDFINPLVRDVDGIDEDSNDEVRDGPVLHKPLLTGQAVLVVGMSGFMVKETDGGQGSGGSMRQTLCSNTACDCASPGQ